MRIDASHNRLQLVKAVRDLVADRGTADVSAREIATKAGVSTATLYRHFESKEALIDEVSVVRWNQLERYARQTPQYDASPVRQVIATLEAFTRMVSSDDSFILATGLKVGRSPAVIQPIRNSFEPVFASLWVAAQQARSIRSSADPRDALDMAGAIRDKNRRIPMMTLLAAGICADQVDAGALVREASLLR